MPDPIPSLDLHRQSHRPQEREQVRGEALPRNLYGHCSTPKRTQPGDDWGTGLLVSCFVFFKSTEEGVYVERESKCACVCVTERERERQTDRQTEGERVSKSPDIAHGHIQKKNSYVLQH